MVYELDSLGYPMVTRVRIKISFCCNLPDEIWSHRTTVLGLPDGKIARSYHY